MPWSVSVAVTSQLRKMERFIPVNAFVGVMGRMEMSPLIGLDVPIFGP